LNFATDSDLSNFLHVKCLTIHCFFGKEPRVADGYVWVGKVVDLHPLHTIVHDLRVEEGDKFLNEECRQEKDGEEKHDDDEALETPGARFTNC
jgi:hypothetical protein